MFRTKKTTTLNLNKTIIDKIMLSMNQSVTLIRLFALSAVRTTSAVGGDPFLINSLNTFDEKREKVT